MSSRALYWFRRDLRLHDNELLERLSRESKEAALVYIFDPREWTGSEFGFSRTGPDRARFLWESLSDLSSQLESRGLKLHLAWGKPEDLIPEWVSELGISKVFFQHLPAYEERRIEARLEKTLASSVSISRAWTYTLFSPELLPFSIEQLPRVFSAFRRKVERVHFRSLFSSLPDVWPKSLSLSTHLLSEKERWQYELEGRPASQFSLISFEGGERAGKERLKTYFWEDDSLRNYKKTRNQLIGADYSSKFSAWLNLGCLSPRYVVEEVRRYENERIKNQSTYWLVFELLWREYFQWVAYRFGSQLFAQSGPKDVERSYRHSPERLVAWCEGKTGIPFIDANMRELVETGFMSNRGRQNVASFFVHDLKLDWRIGASFFESRLIDYDPASNWGNWAYLSGVGQDPRERRRFNILKQAYQYDPEQEFISYWIPSLRQVPEAFRHHPHLMPGASSRPQDESELDLYFRPLIRLRRPTLEGDLGERDESESLRAFSRS